MSTRIHTPAVAAVAAAVIAALGATVAAQADEQKASTQQNSTPQHKQGASKQENIGVVTGLAVGAAAGGPIGAVVGAAAGAWLGDRYHRQQQSRETLAGDLSRTESERARLAEQVTSLDTSLHAALAESARKDALVAQARELATDVSFRTADFTLTLEDIARLQHLGGVAASIPDARIRISGYADPRGTAQYNLTLSRQRAESVASVLRAAGVPAERLVVEAHGAQEAAEGAPDLDAYALERRVIVQLESMPAGALAQVR